MRTANIVKPLSLDGAAGPLFAVYYPPMAGTARRAGVIYVPPFAEEMNRSRRMAALQARALAAQGIGVLLLDLFGTGDSAGDFAEARWATWLADILAAADWLESEARAPVGLWGLRLGALLTAAAAVRSPGRFQRLLFWQPVLDGKSMLTQFLRIRVAASMAESRGETTHELRASWARGESVEVAGYMLSAELAQALDGLHMNVLRPARGTRVDWLDVAAEASEGVPPAGQGVVEAWRSAGIDIHARAVAGDPFWALQETTIAAALLGATTELLRT
jgi:exosortase A-associated hydrolase 2